jgi:hypothetical protein
MAQIAGAQRIPFYIDQGGPYQGVECYMNGQCFPRARTMPVMYGRETIPRHRPSPASWAAHASRYVLGDADSGALPERLEGQPAGGRPNQQGQKAIQSNFFVATHPLHNVGRQCRGYD